MRKYIIIIGFMCFSPYLIANSYEKYANWSDIRGVEESFYNSLINSRHQVILGLNEINIPPFPGSDLLKLDEYMCAHDLSSLLLVSEKSVDEIVNWYESKLSGFFKSSDNTRTFFVYGFENFDYSSDSVELKNREYISIRKIEETLSKIAPKYNTVIEIGFFTNKVKKCKTLEGRL